MRLLELVFLFIHLVYLCSTSSSPLPFSRKSLYSSIYSKYEGDIYLAAMFSIHHSGLKPSCGRIIDQDGLQVISATTFALKFVKENLNLPLDIGLLAIDTCQDPMYGLEQSKDFLFFKSCKTSETYSCTDNSKPKVKEEYKSIQRVFGIFGAGNSDVSILAATFLRLVELPQVSYFSTSPELSDPDKYFGFFRTIPSDNFTVQAIANLLRRYGWNFPLIVSDESPYSVNTKERFNAFVKSTNQGNNTLCISKNIVILQSKGNESIKSAVYKIKDQINDEHGPKVVVTILSQSVVEDLLNYIEINPIEEFGHLIWIGTDSWGGRKWPNISKNNLLLNNSISIIPRSYEMKEFMDYYKTRLPSKDDYDPWLAEKFEQVCNCQYSNSNLFIYPELEKIRTQMPDMKSCESIESQCSSSVFKDSLQMPYIHYVVDGIMAYAYAVKAIIGKKCEKMNKSGCADYIWRNGIINSDNLIKQLVIVNFTDFSNKTFYFWNGKEGVPSYSVFYFNNTIDKWINVGHIAGYMETISKYYIKLDEEFERIIRNKYIIPPCSSGCPDGNKRRYVVESCCWNCELCPEKYIVSNSSDMCIKCEDGFRANITINKCIKMKESFLKVSDYGALIIVLADIFGILFCMFTFVVLTMYLKTPIIKAFGKETGYIILLGTILFFTFSIALIGKPNYFRCYIYWFIPALFNTMCYVAILTKTYRIVKIFGMNSSSKRKKNPKFISPLSQIVIVFVITSIESCIVIVHTIIINIEVDKMDTQSDIVIICKKMSTGNLLSLYLLPTFLLLSNTIYAFKMRNTPDGFNETRNINFMNFANCVVLVTSLFLYELLDDINAIYPICLQMTLGAYSNLICLFAPRIYLVLCRPDKNTIESVIARSKSISCSNILKNNTAMSDLNQALGKNNLRCRKCNTVAFSSTTNDAFDETGQSIVLKMIKKSQPNVFFTNEEFNNADIGIQNFAFVKENS